VQFGDGITLAALDIPTTAADDVTIPSQWWIAPTVPPNVYSASFFLIQAGQPPAAQGDVAIPTYAVDLTQVTIPLENVPAGDYGVYVVVYAWQTGERLESVKLPTQERGAVVLVGQITVR
jgi:hypothetical protein